MVDRSSEAGSMSLELVIVAPAIISLLLLLAIGGRLTETRLAVQGAARSAARAASLEREVGDAVEAAKSSAESTLKDRDLTCDPVSVVTDTSRFSPPGGEVGSVSVSVECTVHMTGFDPLLSGTRLVRGKFTEPVDRFRESTIS